MDAARRTLLRAAGAAGLLPAAAAAEEPAFDPVPPLPAKPSPGKPGDFDFLEGEWRIEHLRRLPAGGWDRFSGEATCRTLLGGVGSVEELRIPARGFSGMGLRLLDLERRRWSDFWVNAKSGVLTTPGQEGSFENGAGIFWSEYEEDGRTMLAAGIWDRIARGACRWRQATSADGGRSWKHDWVMDWRRA